ncbi:hypothetical protein F444_12931 [Phytophthora nicotianae P1976]|uniref:Uncharacterized protein n=1 Tax=Phytophthora nicotianae P1976 TaxID=1317066 RepID=A0A080ZVF5_PHYNI|nr:hypothetical protein F444_12931 [Phytophthora nicotianae P1976]
MTDTLKLMSITVAVTTIVLATLAEAGYVALYKDTYFKDKLVTVDAVVVDVCYTFKCDNGNGESVDNMISSAKWHGLPEESKIFARGQSVITFYTDQNCKGDAKSWYVTTQSKSNMHFPENFRLDGINDEISSFKVISAGGDSGPFRVCGPSEKINLANTSSANDSR